jgi:ubiquinol-cytochrome c reductase cytochrome b subunit
MHLLAVHEHGSSNPLGYSGNSDRLAFHPYFVFKDLVTVIAFLLVLFIFVCYFPNFIGHEWPLLILLLLILVSQCAICWNCFKIHCKTLLLSYFSILYNLICKIFFYIYSPKYNMLKRSTDKVKYYNEKHNQQITNVYLNNIQVGISETLRTQKKLFSSSKNIDHKFFQ